MCHGFVGLFRILYHNPVNHDPQKRKNPPKKGNSRDNFTRNSFITRMRALRGKAVSGCGGKSHSIPFCQKPILHSHFWGFPVRISGVLDSRVTVRQDQRGRISSAWCEVVPNTSRSSFQGAGLRLHSNHPPAEVASPPGCSPRVGWYGTNLLWGEPEN